MLPIWRERDAKNYYRSLDYAALTFRTVDRKATTTQRLLEEIKKKNGHWVFDYGEDIGVMKDVVRVVLSYATRHHAIVDRDVVRAFLQKFLPWLFGIYDVKELQPSSSSSSNNNNTNSSQPITKSIKLSSPKPIHVILPSSSSSSKHHSTSSSSSAYSTNHTLDDDYHHQPIYLNQSTPLATPPSSDHVDFDMDDGSKNPIIILDNSDDDSFGQRSPYSRSSSPISFSPPGTTGTTFDSPYRSGYPKSTCLFCNEDFYCFLRYYQARSFDSPCDE